MTTTPTDAFLRDILTTARTFACVGVSPDPIRPSNYVARYLARRGYRIIPVNPGHAGRTLFGQTVMANLASIEDRVDVLDIFRKPAAVPAIVEDGLRRFPELKCVWLQVGIVSPDAEAMCTKAGVPIVQDRCPKIEHQRLFGELRKAGFNTGIVSSRLT
ncbi:CoA-binding protein [Jannaschia sp. S6380]|uniref:CoA-binding protein n=1 Tax=Jannaschia sp. S6380 TaxID=2926408 RepID=UPI001FF51B6B|nr:CoA-binding protein [Jannaschia sp. S6380]MCK0167400.1 CoA-binding protein [Jannaschia sp. S6380]